MSQQAPFVIQPQLTAVALAYRNSRMIADQALPRVPVESPTFKYTIFAKADAFTIPQTLVGRKGKVNEIDWSATEQSESVSDYGLEDAIPYRDTMAARAPAMAHPIDPEARATELLSDLIALDRERRAAAVVFDPANYATDNKVDVDDNVENQWDDFDSSDPIGQIITAQDGMIVRPNTFVLGRKVASALRRHPAILKAFNGTLGDTGVVPLAFLQQLFEIENILVGEAWVNSAKKGQAISLTRVWGNHAALLYLDPVNAATQGGNVTFGFSAEWGTRQAGTRQDPDIGLRGGTRVRVGESIKELVVANDAGYLFENAIAG